MQVTYVRSSSYNNYDFCQQQYFINYVLGHPSGSGKKAEMGTIVHKTMEGLALAKKAVQDDKKSFKDDVMGRVRLTKDKMLSDNFVDRLFNKCLDFYTDKSVHPYTLADKKNCRKWVQMAIDYNGGQFDPRKREIIEAEPQFEIVIDEPWAEYNYVNADGSELKGRLAIKGTVDLVTKIDEETSEVIDWKTGKRIDWVTGEEKDYDKLSKDPQLLLYHYALSRMFPEYKQTIMTIFYIKDGGPFSLCFDESDEEIFLTMLKNRFEEIKSNQSPQMLSEEQSHWKCTKICDYYKRNWPNTNVNMCRHIHEQLSDKGMDHTVSECTKEGFSIGYYDAPG